MSRIRLLLLVLCFPVLILASHAVDPSSPIIQTASGKVQGTIAGNLMVFKGVPFAAPPVGSLRWRPPQQVKPWNGVRSATAYGHDCMQTLLPQDAPLFRTQPSEDCLYLNVWAPRNRGRSLLPVMVWIYGGGFVNGGTSPAAYDGSQFARGGVVFVSFNYRLARFGFFAFPALEAEGGDVGNYAFMDQIAALRWVQNNIATFGGNPHEVTVFGESAGGASVNVLLTSPQARGLFERAMIESGGGRDTDTVFPPVPLDHADPNGQASAEQTAVAFAKSMGINGTGASALAALRRLPAKKIVNGINRSTRARQRDTYSGHILDGKLIVQAPEDVFKEGKQAKVPVLVGANSADLGFAPGSTIAAIFKPFGTNAAAARRAFDVTASDTPATVSRRVGAVQNMIEPARFIAQRVTAGGESAYVYRFSYLAAALRKRLPGAPHAYEIPYVFDTIREFVWPNFEKGITAADLSIARQVNAYWLNFAKTGNPNGPGLPPWPKYTASGDRLMNFTIDGPKAERDPWQARLDLVEKIQK